jgi:hypothetical protein
MLTKSHNVGLPARPSSKLPLFKSRGLTRRHLPELQRLRLALAWIRGEFAVSRPKLEHASAVFDVPLKDLRRHVGAGNGHNGNGRRKTRVDRLKADFRDATASELTAVAHDIGVGTIWDRLIAPVLDHERTAVEQPAE